jgi:VanZ family protein
MFLRFNLFTFLWAGIIFLLILMPGQEMPKMGEDLFNFDKFAHLGVFGILSFFMILGFSKQNTYPGLKSNPIRYALIISTLYASILELGQSLIPDRYANYYDMTFNLLGVFIGAIIFLLIYKFSFN